MCVCRLLNSSYTGALGFGGEIVEAYSAWTAAVNGLGLPAFAEIERVANDWNEEFYVLFAAALINAPGERFDAQIQLVTGLPDQPFGDVTEILIHAADILYFNEPRRSAVRPIELRARLVTRTLALRRWKLLRPPGDLSIDHDTGGLVAKLLLNTYDHFGGTRSYLVPAVFDRLDPLLEPLRPRCLAARRRSSRSAL